MELQNFKQQTNNNANMDKIVGNFKVVLLSGHDKRFN